MSTCTIAGEPGRRARMHAGQHERRRRHRPFDIHRLARFPWPARSFPHPAGRTARPRRRRAAGRRARRRARWCPRRWAARRCRDRRAQPWLRWPDHAAAASARPAWTGWRARPAGPARRRWPRAARAGPDVLRHRRSPARTSAARPPWPPSAPSASAGRGRRTRSGSGIFASVGRPAVSSCTSSACRNSTSVAIGRVVHHLLGERHHARADLLVAVGRRPQDRARSPSWPHRGCGARSSARTAPRTAPPPAPGSSGSRRAATAKHLRPQRRSAPHPTMRVG